MQSKRLLSEPLLRLSLPSSLSPACTLCLKFFLKFSPLAWPWIVLCPNIDPLKHSKLLADTQTTPALQHLKCLLQSIPLGRQRRAWESSLVSDGFNLTESIFHAIQCSAVRLSTCCVLLTVMPTIEKLLNADWKEKLLDKSTVGAGQLKGQLSALYHLYSTYISLFPTHHYECV